MNGREKSDRSIVPVKSSNKSGAAAHEAEGMEGRERAKGNLDMGDMPRTQSRTQRMPNTLDRIREVLLCVGALRRHHPRQEPDAVVPHVRICTGGPGKPGFLPC
jgi:hypothetical protein